MKRAVEVVVARNVALPAPGYGAQAALALYGPLGRKAQVDLHIKKPSHRGTDKDGDDVDDEDDDEETWTSSSTSPIAIDGFDEFGLRQNLPGLGIEDPVTLARIQDKLPMTCSMGRSRPTLSSAIR